EVARVLVLRALGKTAVVEQRARLGASLRLLVALPRRAEDAAEGARMQPAVHADQRVLERRHGAEETDVLEGAPDAELGDLVLRQTSDLVAVEQDLARRRRVCAGEHVEERRLAGAVGPDQARDRTAWDDEV